MLVASVFGLSFKNVTGNLVVTVIEIRNSNGEIDFTLFNKADGFPDDGTKAIKHLRGKITNGKCLVTFENIPLGEYAIAIYHDENNDRKINKAWYGKPLEGVGVSNNAKGGAVSAPKYNDAKFYLSKLEQTTSISMMYL